jgi:ice-binding like protein
MAASAHNDLIGKHVETPRRFVWGAAATRRSLALMAFSLLAALALVSSAQAQAPVLLGTADDFAALGATTVTSTGPTVVNGDLGVSPGTAVTGFGPGTVYGTIYSAGAVAAQAQSDLTAAYEDAASRVCQEDLTGSDLGGMILTQGVYCFSSSVGLTGTLTLDAQGDPSAVFIFQIGSTLTTASASTVSLINGAQSCGVYWQVGSSATLGTTTTFSGNVLALTSNTATTGVTIDGRLLARNGAVTLDSNTITRAQCAAVPVVPDPVPVVPVIPDPVVPDPGAVVPAPIAVVPDPIPLVPVTPDPIVSVPILISVPAQTRPPAGAEKDETAPVVNINGAAGDGIIRNPVGAGYTSCLPGDFRLRIRTRDASGIRRVDVFLDGRLIKRSTHGQFDVWITAERLVGGRHTIRVVARDNEGNRTVQTRRFTRCNRPVLPPFTG